MYEYCGKPNCTHKPYEHGIMVTGVGPDSHVKCLILMVYFPERRSDHSRMTPRGTENEKNGGFMVHGYSDPAPGQNHPKK